MRNPETLPLILQEAGFDIVEIQFANTRSLFNTKEELIDYFEGTLAANWNLPVEGRKEFLSDLTERYLQYRPQDQEDDFVYFSLKRCNLIATLKGP